MSPGQQGSGQWIVGSGQGSLRLRVGTAHCPLSTAHCLKDSKRSGANRLMTRFFFPVTPPASSFLNSLDKSSPGLAQREDPHPHQGPDGKTVEQGCWIM